MRHEWPREDPTRPPLWVTRSSTNASEANLRAEVLRLAEEVERLNARLALLTDEESQWQAKKTIEVAERARIRRELQAGLPAQSPAYLDSSDYNKGWNAAARMADEVVRRICPEAS